MEGRGEGQPPSRHVGTTAGFLAAPVETDSERLIQQTCADVDRQTQYCEIEHEGDNRL